MKEAIKGTLVIIGLIAVLFLLAILGRAFRIISLPFWKLDQQIKSNEDIIKKTYDADNVLYNYRWFKDRMGEIKATETKIQIAVEERDSFVKIAGDYSKYTFEDKQEYSRLTSNITGLKNYYKTIVEEYNSRASQADRAIFQEELPLFWSLKPY